MRSCFHSDHPLANTSTDKHIWPLTASGIFITSYVYQQLCKQHQPNPMPTNFTTPFWLKFWKLKVPYRLQIFLWKVLPNILPVKTKLFHTTTISHTCVLCNSQHPEDLDHHGALQKLSYAFLVLSAPSYAFLDGCLASGRGLSYETAYAVGSSVGMGLCSL